MVFPNAIQAASCAAGPAAMTYGSQLMKSPDTQDKVAGAAMYAAGGVSGVVCYQGLPNGQAGTPTSPQSAAAAASQYQDPHNKYQGVGPGKDPHQQADAVPYVTATAKKTAPSSGGKNGGDKKKGKKV